MKPPSKHFEFSQKWAIFGRLEKKSFQKWLEPNTFSVCYPNTLLYIVFDHTFAENAAILVKIRNFPFLKNPQFWLFSEVLEVKLKFQDKFYIVIETVTHAPWLSCSIHPASKYTKYGNIVTDCDGVRLDCVMPNIGGQ